MSILPSIMSLNEYVMLVEFGREISVELNERALWLAGYFEKNPFDGFVEVVPAYASTAVIFDPVKVKRAFEEFSSAHEAVRKEIEKALAVSFESKASEWEVVEIPVEFSGADLEYIAKQKGLSQNQVIEIFLSRTYRVYMLGFLPGFAYMGEVDERIVTPRKETPRKAVPKGSVGIAGLQTGIYPLESPGGWQVIGRTPLEIFSPSQDRPCLLKPGDSVKFVRVDA